MFLIFLGFGRSVFDFVLSLAFFKICLGFGAKRFDFVLGFVTCFDMCRGLEWSVLTLFGVCWICFVFVGFVVKHVDHLQTCAGVF